ncbi:MAG: PQQ-binding-like beta-propeller repeat protein [Flavobacteriales bacterium]|nr:PQQ-binding-like beta-propeller repeat protein [Flavobacteriales bacterium]
MNRIILPTMLALSVAGDSAAQIAEHYFADTEQKENGKVETSLNLDGHIVVGGWSFAARPFTPSITMLDTEGEVLWTTTTNDTADHSFTEWNSGAVDHLLDGEDGYIYATSPLDNDSRRIWKVDATDGSIVWRRQLDGIISYNTQHLLRLDSDLVLFAYCSDQNTHNLAYVSRGTGDVTQEYSYGPANGHFGVAVDGSGHLYYTATDSIHKATVAQPSSRLWSRRFADPVLEYYDMLYTDTQDSLFAVGYRDSGSNGARVYGLRTDNGDQRWQAVLFGDVYLRDFNDRFGKLYLTWRHRYVGGGYYAFWPSCVDKLTGEVLWMTSIENVQVGSPDTHSGGGEGAMDCDVDDNGDYYMTGYYGDANYGPECWAIAKIDGTDGSLIYSRTITLFPDQFDNVSCGYGAHVIDGQPCFVGDLETWNENYYERRQATFVRLDPATGEVVLRTAFNGDFQYPSRTVAMRASSEGTYVLKQRGGQVSLELYGPDNSLAWERSFRQSHILRAGQLAVGPAGEAWFTSYSSPALNEDPWITETPDSLWTHCVSWSGTLLQRYGFASLDSTERPTDLIVDAQGRAFLGYARNASFYLRRIASGVLGPEVVSGLSYEAARQRAEAIVDDGEARILLVGYAAPVLKLVGFDKSTQAVTVLDTIVTHGSIRYLQQVLRVSPERLFIIGEGNGEMRMGLYDVSLQDTIWCERAPGGSPMRAVWANDRVYASCGLTNGTGQVSGYSAEAGLPTWAHIVDGPGSGANSLRALAWDMYRNEVIVAGNELRSMDVDAARDVLIERIDASGALLDQIHRAGGPFADNGAYCALVLGNAGVWSGGSLDTNGFGRAGFRYELQDQLNVGIAPGERMRVPGMLAYPQPAGEVLNILVSDANGAADLSLFDAWGRMVLRTRVNTSTPVTLTRNGLPAGMYTLVMSDGDDLHLTRPVLFR